MLKKYNNDIWRENSNNNALEHFVQAHKPIVGGHGSVQHVNDYKLTRYACYLLFKILKILLRYLLILLVI